MVRSPDRGYFLEPNKSILVVSYSNFQRAHSFIKVIGLQVVMVSH